MPSSRPRMLSTPSRQLSQRVLALAVLVAIQCTKRCSGYIASCGLPMRASRRSPSRTMRWAPPLASRSRSPPCALERVEADRLRRHVDVPDGVVERVDPDDVGGLVDRVEVHRLARADHQSRAVGLAPRPVRRPSARACSICSRGPRPSSGAPARGRRAVDAKPVVQSRAERCRRRRGPPRRR